MSRDILIQPIVTEKLTSQMEDGHYAFRVDKRANKIQIRRAIQERYPDVQIKEVRTMVVRGKRRRQMTRRGLVEGRTSAYKKAIVTLMPGSQEIDFFGNV
jgi:large subunit ribosomal protein L23